MMGCRFREHCPYRVEAGYTAGDPHDGGVWTDAGSYAGCNKIELQGLTPGQRYWLRLRALNSNGPGAWTDPAGLMVV